MSFGEEIMDTGQGRFVALPDKLEETTIPEMMKKLEAQYPKHGGWFREGEEIELNGSRFRVKKVKPTEIVLRLLKRAE